MEEKCCCTIVKGFKNAGFFFLLCLILNSVVLCIRKRKICTCITVQFSVIIFISTPECELWRCALWRCLRTIFKYRLSFINVA